MPDILFPFISNSTLHEDAAFQSWDIDKSHKIRSTFPFVPVAIIATCTVSECRSELPAGHLMVEVSMVTRKHGSAVAISYTWGEFNRRAVTLGHDHSGKNLTLELGEEWDLDDLRDSLLMLSQRHGGVWLDQLCLRQNEAHLKQDLASIPYIFRAFDVVALMPGKPCPCFRARWEAVLDSVHPDRTPIERGESENRHRNLLLECQNSPGLNSWFDRVWTFQEMMYSTRISVLWIGRVPAACVKEVSDFERLDKFALKVFHRAVTKGFSHEEAFRVVSFANTAFNHNAESIMDCYSAGRGLPSPTKNGLSSFLNLARFFLGEPIENGQTRTGEHDVYAQLSTFVYNLGVLAEGHRKATKARDYVLAIWLDCPGYEFPENFHSLGAVELLEDAILQMEQNLGYSITVTVPAGLFGRHDATALWRPTAYLHSCDIQDAVQLYAPVTGHPTLMPLRERRTPLAGLGHILPSISARSDLYSRVFRNKNTAEVFVNLKRVVQFWPGQVQNQVAAEHHRVDLPFESLSVTDFNIRKFEKNLIRSAATLMVTGRHEGDWGDLPEVDHYSLMYRLVTYALGLDMELYLDRGLQLVISLDDPPCAGLVSPEFCEQIHGSGSPNLPLINAGKTATICVKRLPSSIGCSLFEGLCIRRNPNSCWNVGGVWVPTSLTALHELQFVVHAAATDSFMGDVAQVTETTTHFRRGFAIGYQIE